MKKILTKNSFLTLALSLGTYLNAVSSFDLDTRPDFLKKNNKDYEIVVQNKPLVKVNGKIFSVVDVQKKMDFLLKEHNPSVFSNPVHRYQYYTSSWRETLSDMIHHELIKMEAEEFKVNIPDGDVREEVLRRFGPNLYARLDELGITYDDAKEICREDIVVRNMSWYRVWARVLQLVKPELIKQEYETYVKLHPPKDEWVYRTITIKSPDTEMVENVATTAYTLLSQNTFRDIRENIDTIKNALPNHVVVHVSDEVRLSSTSLSSQYLSILERLPKGGFSLPESTISKSDQSTVKRIFYLVDHTKEAPPPFEDISTKIRDELIQKYASTQKSDYYAKLRKHFCCEELVVDTLFPPDYQPFYLY